MIRVIIAGSRNFCDNDLFDYSLRNILSGIESTNLEIISGGCTGADAMAEDYAERFGLQFTEFPAYWTKYGKAAGPMRNEQMAKYASDADRGMLIAFPIGESRGTRNMVKLAKQYGLEVYVIEQKV